MTATRRGARLARTITALALLVVCRLAGPATAGGQVLLTGETGGSGAHAVAVAANLTGPALRSGGVGIAVTLPRPQPRTP